MKKCLVNAMVGTAMFLALTGTLAMAQGRIRPLID
jgi:hypothetical protein